MNLLEDIYYQKEYVSLYLREDEEIFEFKYEEDENYLYNISIKRPIKTIANIEVQDEYYDLETAYGYGGMVSNTDDSNFLRKGLEKYIEKCEENKIIAEFTRFHPFNDFYKNSSFYDFLNKDRNTVYVDLNKTKEERWNNYSSKTRNILRKCNRELEIKESSNLNSFLGLYRKTMDKNNADEYYYFDEKYFEMLLNFDNVKLFNIYKDDIVISSSFFLFSNNFGHYHLSANNYDFRKYNANYFILDEAFEFAKTLNVDYFHLGGGRTNEKDDTLLKFKHKFSSLEKEFCIGGKIYNETVYNKFNEIWENENSDNSIKYFLKYRL